MSRSSNSTLALGIGTRELALGVRRSWLARLREPAPAASAAPGTPDPSDKPGMGLLSSATPSGLLPLALPRPLSLPLPFLPGRAAALPAPTRTALDAAHWHTERGVFDALEAALSAMRGATSESTMRGATGESAMRGAAGESTMRGAAGESDNRGTGRQALEHAGQHKAREQEANGPATRTVRADAASGKPQTPRTPARPAHVVLDDFWGNHAILRGDFRSMRPRELEEIALAYFADTYGLDPASLQTRLTVQPGGRAFFASALPRALLDGIHARCADAGVQVQSLTLALPRRLGRLRPVVRARRAMLVLVAETAMHAVMLEDNRWLSYESQRLFAADLADPARLADIAETLFERSPARDQPDCTLYLCGPSATCAALEQRLPGLVRLPPEADPTSALGLLELAR